MPVTTVTEASVGHPALVEVSSPLRQHDLQALPSGPCVVQFSRPLATDDHDHLGRWFAEHPEAELRAYGTAHRTLDFLRAYPELSGFSLDSEIEDAGGLRFLPDTLRWLELGVRLPRPGDLDVIARFRQLDSLGLTDIRRLPESARGLPVTKLSLGGVRTLEGIGSMPDLNELGLHGVKADLAPLTELSGMEGLTLALGGCNDLGPLAEITTLRRFSAWLVRGLEDVGPVAGQPGLEELYLAKMRRVIGLPPLSEARSLVDVTLEGMRGLRDLKPLRDAPALRELWLVEMEHLLAEEVAVLAGHPSLVQIHVGLGSDRKNLAVRDALRITGSYGGHPWPPVG